MWILLYFWMLKIKFRKHTLCLKLKTVFIFDFIDKKTTFWHYVSFHINLATLYIWNTKCLKYTTTLKHFSCNLQVFKVCNWSSTLGLDYFKWNDTHFLRNWIEHFILLQMILAFPIPKKNIYENFQNSNTISYYINL